MQKKTQICVCKKNFQKQAKLIKKMFNQEMFICPVRDYTNSRQSLDYVHIKSRLSLDPVETRLDQV